MIDESKLIDEGQDLTDLQDEQSILNSATL